MKFLTVLIVFFANFAIASEQTVQVTEDVSIPDNGSASAIIEFDSNDFPCGVAISSIDVSYDIVHTYSGDLIVKIVHPDGTEYTLRSRQGGSSDNPSGAENGITAFNGMVPGGQWRLLVSDNAARDTGYIDEVEVTIHSDSNCLTLLDDFAINNLCISFGENNYIIDLPFSNGVWGLGGVAPDEGSESCIEIDSSLNINIPCITYYDHCYQLELTGSPNLQWTLGAVRLAELDECGVLGGDGSTCAGCDGVPNSGLVVDICGVCGGDSECAGCDGVANSGLVLDDCGVCGGDGSSCVGCDGVTNSGLEFDHCGVCGGDGSTCPAPPASLGKYCGNSCDGSFCSTWSSTSPCVDSDLSMPCLGTSSGMYCSQSCTTDADCVNTNTAMKCLTSCPDYPAQAGKCWKTSDHTFMTNRICD